MFQLPSFHPYCISDFLKPFSPGSNTELGCFGVTSRTFCSAGWLLGHSRSIQCWPWTSGLILAWISPQPQLPLIADNNQWFSHHLTHFPLDTLSWSRGPKLSYFKRFIPEHLSPTARFPPAFPIRHDQYYDPSTKQSEKSIQILLSLRKGPICMTTLNCFSAAYMHLDKMQTA